MLRAELLHATQAREVRTLLEQEPDANLYMLAALQSWGLANQDGVRWWGAGHGHGVEAVVWLGRPDPDPGPGVRTGLAVPWGAATACEAIGRLAGDRGLPGMIIGPREAADALWRGLGSPRPRTWFDQRLYVCPAPTPGPRLRLRPARPDELPLVAAMSAAMMREDLGVDPQADDPEDFLARTRARVLSGRCLLGLEDDRVVFKVDVGSRYGQGTQVGGTYVPMEARGRGVATAGMRALCDALGSRTPRVSLHVNEANLPAVRSYERAGFVRDAAFRLAAL